MAIISSAVIGLLIGLTGMLFLWWFDRFGLKSGLVGLGAILLGGAGAAAALACFKLLPGLGSDPSLRITLEMLFQLPGILFLLGRSSFFQGPVDGWLLGSLAAIGSAMVHIAALPAAVLRILWTLRTPFSPVLLLILSVELASLAAFGATLGMAKIWRRRTGAMLWVPAGILGATVLQLLGLSRNYPLSMTWGLVILMCSIWLVLLTVLLAHERAILIFELGEEHRFGVLPDWCVKLFPSRLSRMSGKWGPPLRERRVLNSKVVHLAFRKQALRRNRAGRDLEGLEIVHLREQLKTLVDSVSYRETS